MAENVHFQMEAMLPSLVDWQKRKIFSKKEVESIIKKRTEIEYQLARRISQKIDFLKAIEFEMELHGKFKLRKERLFKDINAIKDSERREAALKSWKKPRDSDTAIVRRIHGLFERSLKKFKSDPILWLQYMEWAGSVRSTKKLGQLYARAIQLHPHFVQFWLLAAKHEQTLLRNTKSARALLQRAIRINADEPKLYVEYFKLEMGFLKRVKGRRELFFGKRATKRAEELEMRLDSESDSELEGSEVDSVDLPILREEIESSEKKTGPKGEQNMFALQDEAQLAFFAGSVPRAVVKEACSRFPSNLDIRISFVQIYELFGDEFAEALDEVYADLSANFATDPRAQIILASRGVAQLKSKSEVDCTAAVLDGISSFETVILQQDSLSLKLQLVKACVQVVEQWLKQFCHFSQLVRLMRGRMAAVYETSLQHLLASNDVSAIESFILFWSEKCTLIGREKALVLRDGIDATGNRSLILFNATSGLEKSCKTRLQLYDQRMRDLTGSEGGTALLSFWTAYCELLGSLPARSWPTSWHKPLQRCMNAAYASKDLRLRDDLFVLYGKALTMTPSTTLEKAAVELDTLFIWSDLSPRVLAFLVNTFALSAQDGSTKPVSRFGISSAATKDKPSLLLVRKWYRELLGCSHWAIERGTLFSVTDSYLSAISFELYVTGDMVQVSRLYEQARTNSLVDHVEFGALYQSLKNSGQFVEIPRI